MQIAEGEIRPPSVHPAVSIVLRYILRIVTVDHLLYRQVQQLLVVHRKLALYVSHSTTTVNKILHCIYPREVIFLSWELSSFLECRFYNINTFDENLQNAGFRYF